MKKLKDEWVAIDGSIYTKTSYITIKIDSEKSIKVQESVAFNIGDVAEYLVRLHNQNLKNVESK